MDPLSHVLAEYFEEADAAHGDAARLKALRARYLAEHPDLCSSLETHFHDEDAVTGEVSWAMERLPRIERYADVARIGQGAMGVVYKAFDRELKRWVALKIPSVNFATPQDARRFRREAENLAQLTHPHILRVFDVTDVDGRPVISMELIRGGSLLEHADRLRRDPRALATLMVAIARAVHHAHQRGILHRDLKPSNVLLGADDQGPDHPYVSDFGLAKLIAAADEPAAESGEPHGHEHTQDGAVIGTASYMSPEQATASGATTLSDVYGLGGILYTLLTDRLPFRGDSVEHTLDSVRDPARAPEHPRRIETSADPTLSAIALKCLEKDPARRYRSAEGVAKDLDRWLARRPTEARPLSWFGRAGLWCRRNPVAAGLFAALLSLAVVAGVNVAARLGEPARIRQAVVQQAAGLMQSRLDEMKRAVESTARDPRIGDVLARSAFPALQELIESEGNRHRDLNGSSPFDTLFVVDDRDGAFVARWPRMDPDSEGLDFRERDYFKGLKASATSSVYVSRVFRAVTDELFKFGVSTAVTHNGRRVGIVVGTVTTDARMGLAELENRSFVTSVLALRDSHLMPGETGTPPPGASPYVILLHPAYQRGIEPRWFPADQLASLELTEVEDYEDPTAGLGGEAAVRYGGLWAASLARVPNSHFVVMVQQRSQPWLFPVQSPVVRRP